MATRKAPTPGGIGKPGTNGQVAVAPLALDSFLPYRLSVLANTSCRGTTSFSYLLPW